MDEATEQVTFPEFHYWDAKKGTFGENTTELQKALAYRHFVRMVRERGPMLLLRAQCVRV